MLKDIQLIPDLLRKCNNNKSAVGRIVGLDRRTIKLYESDFEGVRHAFVGGVLMVAQGNRGLRKK